MPDPGPEHRPEPQDSRGDQHGSVGALVEFVHPPQLDLDAAVVELVGAVGAVHLDRAFPPVPMSGDADTPPTVVVRVLAAPAVLAAIGRRPEVVAVWPDGPVDHFAGP
jgi:hypothetical protein